MTVVVGSVPSLSLRVVDFVVLVWCVGCRVHGVWCMRSR
jgi:hypothetical protein